MSMDSFSLMLFKTVKVRNVTKHLHEDFALLLAKKCGKVAQWKSFEKELMVAFDSVDAMSSALALDGLKYDGQKVIIWKASIDPPAAVLAIDGPKKGESEEDKAESRTMRERIRDMLSQLNEENRAARAAGKAVGASTGGVDGKPISVSIPRDMTPEEREAFLKEHARRQAKALLVLGNHWESLQKAELERLKAQLAHIEGKPTTGPSGAPTITAIS